MLQDFNLSVCDNDVNRVHRKFPLDICLICLNFSYSKIKLFGLAFVLFYYDIYILIYSRATTYLHCFNVYILTPYAYYRNYC